MYVIMRDFKVVLQLNAGTLPEVQVRIHSPDCSTS